MGKGSSSGDKAATDVTMTWLWRQQRQDISGGKSLAAAMAATTLRCCRCRCCHDDLAAAAATATLCWQRRQHCRRVGPRCLGGSGDVVDRCRPKVGVNTYNQNLRVKLTRSPSPPGRLTALTTLWPCFAICTIATEAKRPGSWQVSAKM
jgi:hypothetical protein